MAGQTTYSLAPGIGFEGQVYTDVGKEIVSGIADGSIRMGIGLYKDPASSARMVKQPPAPTYLGDADSIKTNGASTAGIVTYSGADFQGALGAADFDYPMNLTLSNNAHNDWDAGTWHIYGLDDHGRPAYDRWTQLADVANTELLTDFRIRFSRVHSIVRPAQTGTNGTFTIGTGLLIGALSKARLRGIAVLDTSIEQAATPLGYEDGMEVSIGERGEYVVLCEDTVIEGAQAFVRLVATGSEVRGAWRGTPDGTIGTAPDCAPVIGAFFKTAVTGPGLAVLQLR